MEVSFEAQRGVFARSISRNALWRSSRQEHRHDSFDCENANDSKLLSHPVLTTDSSGTESSMPGTPQTCKRLQHGLQNVLRLGGTKPPCSHHIAMERVGRKASQAAW